MPSQPETSKTKPPDHEPRRPDTRTGDSVAPRADQVVTAHTQACDAGKERIEQRKRARSSANDPAAEDTKQRLELEKTRTDRIKLTIDLMRWAVGGLVIIVGFLMVRPREQARLDREQQRLDIAFKRELFNGYVTAQDTVDISLWQRKLDLMDAFVLDDDEKLQSFLKKEQERLSEIRRDQKKAIAFEQELAKTRDTLAATSSERDRLRKQLNAAQLNDEQRVALNEEISDLGRKVEMLSVQLVETRETLDHTIDKLAGQGVIKTSVELLVNIAVSTGGPPGVTQSVSITSDPRDASCRIFSQLAWMQDEDASNIDRIGPRGLSGAWKITPFTTRLARGNYVVVCNYVGEMVIREFQVR